MKSFAIRLSVLALAATGFAASSVSSKSANSYDIKPTVVGVVASGAMCPANGGKDYCGMH